MNIFFSPFRAGGDDGIRTHDPLLAGQVLSQLSYTPIFMRFAVFSVLQSKFGIGCGTKDYRVPVLMSRGCFSFLLDSSSLTLHCFGTLGVLCSLDESTKSLCATLYFSSLFYFVW